VRKSLTILSAVLLVAAAGAQACDDQGATKTAAVTTEAAHKTFDGTLVCMGCDLKKAEGARASCSAFGHKHAVKTADGIYVNLLENQYSKDLLAGDKYHNKLVKVHGVYHATANQLDVETFTVDGKQKGWCDGCKSMDGCGYASKGSTGK